MLAEQHWPSSTTTACRLKPIIYWLRICLLLYRGGVMCLPIKITILKPCSIRIRSSQLNRSYCSCWQVLEKNCLFVRGSSIEVFFFNAGTQQEEKQMCTASQQYRQCIQQSLGLIGHQECSLPQPYNIKPEVKSCQLKEEK